MAAATEGAEDSAEADEVVAIAAAEEVREVCTPARNAQQKNCRIDKLQAASAIVGEAHLEEAGEHPEAAAIEEDEADEAGFQAQKADRES